MLLIMEVMLFNMDCMLLMSEESIPSEIATDEDEEELELVLFADEDTDEDDLLEDDDALGVDEDEAGFLAAGGGTTVFTFSTMGVTGVQTPGVTPVSSDEQRSGLAQSLGE